MSKLLLESKACGRCGGDGRYSFNQMHGSRCYGCNGRGEVLTKRGRAAQNWLNAQRMVRADSLVVGDKYYSEGFNAGSYVEPNRWITIQSIEKIADGMLAIRGVDARRNNDPHGIYAKPEQLIRKAMSADQVRALHAAALEYQSRLNEHGKESA